MNIVRQNHRHLLRSIAKYSLSKLQSVNTLEAINSNKNKDKKDSKETNTYCTIRDMPTNIHTIDNNDCLKLGIRFI